MKLSIEKERSGAAMSTDEKLREIAKQMGDEGYCNYEACLKYLRQARNAALDEAAAVVYCYDHRVKHGLVKAEPPAQRAHESYCRLDRDHAGECFYIAPAPAQPEPPRQTCQHCGSAINPCGHSKWNVVSRNLNDGSGMSIAECYECRRPKAESNSVTIAQPSPDWAERATNEVIDFILAVLQNSEMTTEAHRAVTEIIRKAAK